MSDIQSDVVPEMLLRSERLHPGSDPLSPIDTPLPSRSLKSASQLLEPGLSNRDIYGSVYSSEDEDRCTEKENRINERSPGTGSQIGGPTLDETNAEKMLKFNIRKGILKNDDLLSLSSNTLNIYDTNLENKSRKENENINTKCMRRYKMARTMLLLI